MGLKNRTMPFCLRAAALLCGLAALLPAMSSNGRMMLVVRPDRRSGRLVRSVAVNPGVIPPRVVLSGQPDAPAPGHQPSTISEAVDQAARQHALPPELLHSVIKVESNYNPLAISPKGALGLMQLVPATARRFGVSDVFDPEENIRGGARYLKYLLDLFNGHYGLALAAYNAGEGAVVRYGGIPPYRETIDYLYSVKRQWERSVRQPKPGRAQPVAEPALAHNTIHEITGADGRVHYVSSQE